MKKLVFLPLLVFIVQCGHSSSRSTPNEPAVAETPQIPIVGSSGGHSSAQPTPAPTGVTTTPTAFSLQVKPKVGAEDLACFDKTDAMLARGQVFTDVRLFVSDLTLVDDAGKEVHLSLDQVDGNGNLQYVDASGHSIALLNFLEAGCAASDATKVVKTSVTGTLPQGHYKALRFQLGLPYEPMAPELTAIPAALAPTDMGWMWEHFPADLQIELNTGTSKGAKKKILNALTAENKTVIELAIDYTQGNAAGTLDLGLDLSKLFRTTAADFVSGIESACNNSSSKMNENAVNCAYAYKALGLEVVSPKEPYKQSVFTIAP